ncbi:MAG: Fe-S oxidoreductase, partial [Elusimicrobia bacterium]|nr:Fe-S oxidoreductase [Elusimicrobiota bacterium]
PDFPVPAKSKNHCNFLPIGLLKMASYHKGEGDEVRLNRGNMTAQFIPDEIKITSLFTYWSKYVHDSVKYYRDLYPNAKIQVGGIYASLMPEHAKTSGCDEVLPGLYEKGAAEKLEPAYDLVNVDYQIIHASRGCFRKCNFCGTWKIEPEVTYKTSIKNEIKKPQLVFYDNNLLANPNIKIILKELSEFRFPNRQRVSCESQSGFDGRILVQDPELAKLLKSARFKNPRIAWDGPYLQWTKIKRQIKILKEAGYNSTDIFVFMLFNHDLSYSEMLKKLDACRRWGVRIVDCRFRPLDSLSDGYNSRAKRQDSTEYFIHKNWTDYQVRSFRRKVRRQNIALILNLPNGKYITGVEKRYIPITR